MRSGRVADREGAWGEAFSALSGAVDSFEAAAAQEPDNRRAAGNWGNALLELGQVRLRVQGSRLAASTLEPLSCIECHHGVHALPCVTRNAGA